MPLLAQVGAVRPEERAPQLSGRFYTIADQTRATDARTDSFLRVGTDAAPREPVRLRRRPARRRRGELPPHGRARPGEDENEARLRIDRLSYRSRRHALRAAALGGRPLPAARACPSSACSTASSGRSAARERRPLRRQPGFLPEPDAGADRRGPPGRGLLPLGRRRERAPERRRWASRRRGTTARATATCSWPRRLACPRTAGTVRHGLGRLLRLRPRQRQGARRLELTQACDGARKALGERQRATARLPARCASPRSCGTSSRRSRRSSSPTTTTTALAPRPGARSARDQRLHGAGRRLERRGRGRRRRRARARASHDLLARDDSGDVTCSRPRRVQQGGRRARPRTASCRRERQLGPRSTSSPTTARTASRPTADDILQHRLRAQPRLPAPRPAGACPCTPRALTDDEQIWSAGDLRAEELLMTAHAHAPTPVSSRARRAGIRGRGGARLRRRSAAARAAPEPLVGRPRAGAAARRASRPTASCATSASKWQT